MATAKTHPDNDPFNGEKSPIEDAWYYQCTSTECNLRFPAPELIRLICPICRSPVERIDQWQVNNMDQMPGQNVPLQLSVVLDNLRSAYNVGSILRTADGAGFNHAYLCGITPTPDHPRLAKTALSAEIHTSWSQHRNGVDLVRKLKEEGIEIIGLETSPDATNLLTETRAYSKKFAVVVGNEVYGIDRSILALCNRTYYLPMAGLKQSLNVAVSFGIAAYFFNHKHPVQSDS